MPKSDRLDAFLALKLPLLRIGRHRGSVLELGYHIRTAEYSCSGLDRSIRPYLSKVVKLQGLRRRDGPVG